MRRTIGKTGWLACGGGAALLFLAPGLLAAPAAERHAPRATLDVILSSRPLPPLTLTAMRNEAERIWLREGVQLRWHSATDDIPNDARALRLDLVDEYASPGARAEYALGDFRPSVGTVRVSLSTAAQATTAGLSGLLRPQQPFDYPLALGYVLGRAIAHEIGHGLLGPAHSRSGLMQPAFKPSHLVDRHSARFQLTPEDAANLFHRMDDGQVALRVRAPATPPDGEPADDADALAR